MKRLGSTIECYRGETFQFNESYTDENGQPLTIPPNIKNPYLKFSVKSSLYPMDGKYEKNYWLDLSHYPKLWSEPVEINYSELLEKLDCVFVDRQTKCQVIFPESLSDVTKVILKFQLTNVNVPGENVGGYILQSYMPDSSMGFLVTPSKTIAYAVKGKFIDTLIPINSEPHTIVYDFVNNIFMYDDNAFGGGNPGILQENQKITMFLDDYNVNFSCKIYEMTVQSAEYVHTYIPVNKVLEGYDGEKGLMQFSNGAATDVFLEGMFIGRSKYRNVNNLYYKYDSEGNRQYFIYSEQEKDYLDYDFTIVKNFLNIDTSKWISQIYQYSISICSGNTMNSWLTDVFRSLYIRDFNPDKFLPMTNDQLANYICKKDKNILKCIDITEPLANYQTNFVLQGPSKLIVKEI